MFFSYLDSPRLEVNQRALPVLSSLRGSVDGGFGGEGSGFEPVHPVTGRRIDQVKSTVCS